MKEIFLLCFFALFSVILLEVISPLSPNFRGLFLSGASILFFLYFLKWTAPVLNTLSAMIDNGGFSNLFQPLWKGLGISVLVTLCASFCRDLGEEGIAGKLEMGGKAALLALSLPILEKILEMIGEILP